MDTIQLLSQINVALTTPFKSVSLESPRLCQQDAKHGQLFEDEVTVAHGIGARQRVNQVNSL